MTARIGEKRNLSIIKVNYECEKCGHRKAFQKSIGKECCRCKHINARLK